MNNYAVLAKREKAIDGALQAHNDLLTTLQEIHDLTLQGTHDLGKLSDLARSQFAGYLNQTRTINATSHTF